MEDSHISGMVRSENGTADDPFNTLRAFNAIVEHGSISTAARVLDWPKSTLSRRLHTLERQLGQTLMQRSSEGMTLTEAGRCYCDYCQRILALASEAQRAVHASAQELTGRIRVRVSHDLNWGWITKALNQFLERHPAITLDIQYFRPSHTFHEAEADLWVWSGAEPKTHFHYLPIGAWQRRIYSAADTAMPIKIQHPSELANYPWIAMAGDEHKQLTAMKSQDSFALDVLTPRFQVENVHMLADSIAQGYGLGILPTWYARCQIHGKPGTFQPILKEWAAPSIPLGLLYPPGPVPQRVERLLALLKKTIPKNWRKGI